MSSQNSCGDPNPTGKWPSLGVFSSANSAAFWGCSCGITGCIGCNSSIYPSPNTYINPYPWYPAACNICNSTPCVCVSNWTVSNSTYTFANWGILSKSKAKADILGDFFGPGVHALVLMDEKKGGGANFVPFMDKFNMVWLQTAINSWGAYDRIEFLDWANSENTVFNGKKLSKEEVIVRMMRPEPKQETK